MSVIDIGRFGNILETISGIGKKEGVSIRAGKVGGCFGGCCSLKMAQKTKTDYNEQKVLNLLSENELRCVERVRKIREVASVVRCSIQLSYGRMRLNTMISNNLQQT